MRQVLSTQVRGQCKMLHPLLGGAPTQFLASTDHTTSRAFFKYFNGLEAPVPSASYCPSSFSFLRSVFSQHDNAVG